MVMSSLGGLIAIGVAAWQTMILNEQTKVMSDQTGAMLEQTRKMDEANALTRELHQKQRQTDMIKLFYDSTIQAPVRTMALRELLFEHERHPDLHLTNADLSGVRLAKANFKGSLLIRANLTNAYFAESHFDGATLQSSALQDATFGTLDSVKPTSLQRAVLALATGERADFSGATLAAADLRSSVLPHANFQHTSAPFVHASSPEFEAKRRNCPLPGRTRLITSFEVASGSPTAAETSAPPQTNLNHAMFWHSRWSASSLPGSSLRNAELTGAHFVHAWLDAVDLTGSAIRGSDFGCSVLESSVFNGADIALTSFQRTRMEAASFRDSKLSAVDFSHSALRCADFTGATVDTARQDHMIRFAGTDLRMATGISPELWKASCVDARTRLPADAPSDLPTCPPNERPRRCQVESQNTVRRQIRLSDLVSLHHFFYEDIRGFIVATAAERGFEVVDDMTVTPSNTPPSEPSP